MPNYMDRGFKQNMNLEQMNLNRSPTGGFSLKTGQSKYNATRGETKAHQGGHYDLSDVTLKEPTRGFVYAWQQSRRRRNGTRSPDAMTPDIYARYKGIRV